jgi:hypothetical protein
MRKNSSSPSSSGGSVNGDDHKFLFSTITVISHQKDKEVTIADREIVRLISTNIRFGYSKSRNIDDEEEAEQQE